MLPFIFSRGLGPRTVTQAANATPNNEIQMDNMPRLSTESQRRNGYRQSRADDRCTRIIEDLQNGVSQCSICMSMIHAVDNPDSLWACRSCHNVFHFRCAKDWATSSRVASFGSASWKCPQCLAYQNGSPSARCWCGKESYGRNITLGRTAIPNACRNECQRRGTCSHDAASICVKDCHPGPCEFLCADTCTGPPSPPTTPTCLEKMCQRIHVRPKGSLSLLVASSTFLAVAYTLWGVLFHLHNEWWTKPYKYLGWASSKGTKVDTGIFFGVFFFQFLTIPIVYFMVRSLGSILNTVLNLDSIATKPSRKALTKSFGGLGLIVFGVGFWSLPIIGFGGGVNIAWYNQMKDSCNGFDVRINMDKPGSASTDERPKVWPQQYSKFTVRSPWIKDQHFHLGSRMKPIANSTEPFQYYHRLSGSTFTTPHVAIDVDFQNHLWRRMILNDTDVANAWIASDLYTPSGRKGNQSLPLLPAFPPVEEKLFGNGSFTKVNKTNPHLHINGLDLSIANMWGFFTDCHQEPFLRVFDTTDLHEIESRKMLDAMWDNKPNDRVVMRTASFGHGRQKLSMCVLEGEVIESIEDRANNDDMEDIVDFDSDDVEDLDDVHGIQDEMLVPFAIIAATRMRVKETGIRETWCSGSE